MTETYTPEETITGNEKPRWDAYYEKKEQRFGGPQEYQRRRLYENKPYLDAITEALPDETSKLLVLGGGSGMEAIHFSKAHINTTVIDLEHGITKRVERNAAIMKAPEVTLIQGNANTLPLPTDSYAVACSHGLLEHFHDKDVIINSISEALRVAKTYVFVVPTDIAGNNEARAKLSLTPISDVNKTGNFGDEDYRSAQEWLAIAEEAASHIDGARVVYKFGYWVPELGKTTNHNENPEKYFDKAVMAGIVITRE